VPALERLRAAGWLGPDDRVVLLNTGTGLKYPEALPSEAPLLARTDDLTER
jgi:threonine synthase